MIKKLRRKFIFINMLLVTLVLVMVFAVQLGSAYRRVVDQSYDTLRSALTWRDHNSPPRFQFEAHADAAIAVRPAEKELPSLADAAPKSSIRMSAILLLPAFVVETDSSGELLSFLPGSNADITEELSQSMAIEAIATGELSGVLPQSNLRFMKTVTDNGQQKLAFVSRSMEVETVWNQLSSGLLLGLLSLVGFFFISLFLSGLAVRPLEQSWEQQRRFVADASHELKTPLTVILTNTNILLSHPNDPIALHQRWLEDCQAEAIQMKGLVEDMLFLAKTDAAKAPTLPARVDVSELLLSYCLSFETVAFEAQVSLDTHIPPDLTLLGDGESLRRLAGILLDNACKYAGSGGGVEVGLARERDELKLWVSNTGVPIPPEHLDHLFDRFYRADTARSRQDGGYGLGLAIAKSIVDTHKGHMEVRSDAEGTVFTVFLPFE